MDNNGHARAQATSLLAMLASTLALAAIPLFSALTQAAPYQPQEIRQRHVFEARAVPYSVVQVNGAASGDAPIATTVTDFVTGSPITLPPITVATTLSEEVQTMVYTTTIVGLASDRTIVVTSTIPGSVVTSIIAGPTTTAEVMSTIVLTSIAPPVVTTILEPVPTTIFETLLPSATVSTTTSYTAEQTTITMFTQLPSTITSLSSQWSSTSQAPVQTVATIWVSQKLNSTTTITTTAPCTSTASQSAATIATRTTYYDDGMWHTFYPVKSFSSVQVLSAVSTAWDPPARGTPISIDFHENTTTIARAATSSAAAITTYTGTSTAHRRDVLHEKKSVDQSEAFTDSVAMGQAPATGLTTPEKLHLIMRRGAAPEQPSERDEGEKVTAIRAVKIELTTPEKLHLIMRRDAKNGAAQEPPERRTVLASWSMPERRHLEKRSAPSALPIENWELTTAARKEERKFVG